MVEKTKNKVGAPKKEIDYSMVERLSNIMCTQEEIASCLDLSVRTLQRDEEFCRVYKKGLDNCRVSLRRQQYQLAMEGDKTMLVWLGKQYLEQRDKQDIDNTFKGDKNPVNELIRSIKDLKDEEAS